MILCSSAVKKYKPQRSLRCAELNAECCLVLLGFVCLMGALTFFTWRQLADLL